MVLRLEGGGKHLVEWTWSSVGALHECFKSGIHYLRGTDWARADSQECCSSPRFGSRQNTPGEKQGHLLLRYLK